ncbi:PASTA domain-containing protein [Streptosporangium sp. G11]|uniref:PASTA domain-containing protein n=1 Tax=Streptosporangium sp. G11 TaxID=3436926 RepID=UPI003EBC87A5
MARKSSMNLLAPIIVVLLIVGGCTQLVKKMFGTDEESVKAAQLAALGPLPNLVGKTLVAAKNDVEARGLQLSQAGIGGDSYCSVKSECFVYRMEPKAGAPVQSGGEVAVRFVTSEEWAFYRKYKKKMPKVVGWSQKKATGLFEPIQETVTIDMEQTSRVPEGVKRVLRQSPKPGKPLRFGQKIKLIFGYNPGETSSSTGDGDVDLNFNDSDGNHRGGGGGFCRSKWC